MLAAISTTTLAYPKGLPLFLNIYVNMYTAHVSTGTPVTKYAGNLKYQLLKTICFLLNVVPVNDLKSPNKGSSIVKPVKKQRKI